MCAGKEQNSLVGDLLGSYSWGDHQDKDYQLQSWCLLGPAGNPFPWQRFHPVLGLAGLASRQVGPNMECSCSASKLPMDSHSLGSCGKPDACDAILDSCYQEIIGGNIMTSTPITSGRPILVSRKGRQDHKS